MPNVLLLNGSPTQGGTDGTLVTGGNPVTPDLLTTGNDAETTPLKLAVRTNVGYERTGPSAITPQGANASKWALAADSNGSPGAWGAWGAALLLSPTLRATNQIFWIKARVTSDESYPTLYNDLTVTLSLPDDAYLLVPVGRSLAMGFAEIVGASRALGMVYSLRNIAGRSLDQPFATSGAVGRSLDMPYAHGGYIGQSNFMPYAVQNIVGRSGALPYGIIAATGRSAGLPYTIQPGVTVRAAVLALSPLVYYELSETTGVALNDQGSLNLDATIVGDTGQGLPTLAQTGPKGTDKAVYMGGFGTGHAIVSDAYHATLQFGSGSWTVAAWVKCEDFTRGHNVINFSDYQVSGVNGWYGWAYEILASKKGYLFRGREGSSPNYVDRVTTNDLGEAGVWHHLAYVCDGTTVKVYKDGTLQETWTPSNMSLAAVDNTNRLRVGSGAFDPGQGSDPESSRTSLKGWVAHPCVFGAALSQAQVQTMVNGA